MTRHNRNPTLYTKRSLAMFTLFVILLSCHNAGGEEKSQLSHISSNVVNLNENLRIESKITTTDVKFENNEGNDSNTYFSFAKDDLPSLSEVLIGYLTVVSILVATVGFFLGLAPEYTTAKKRNYYRTLTISMLLATVVLIGYGIFLILMSGHLYFHLVAFISLSIPVGALWSLTIRKLG